MLYLICGELMNTDDFVRLMAKENGYSLSDNEAMLKTVIAIFEKAISTEEEIDIRGFGHLRYKPIKGGLHRFSKYKEPVLYPDSIKLVFSLSDNLRRLIKKKI
jgi:nucleoid DNA-binding protein